MSSCWYIDLYMCIHIYIKNNWENCIYVVYRKNWHVSPPYSLELPFENCPLLPTHGEHRWILIKEPNGGQRPTHRLIGRLKLRFSARRRITKEAQPTRGVNRGRQAPVIVHMKAADDGLLAVGVEIVVMVVPEAAYGPAHRWGDVCPGDVAQDAAHLFYAGGRHVPEGLEGGGGEGRPSFLKAA